jgi:hypothetical protein
MRVGKWMTWLVGIALVVMGGATMQGQTPTVDFIGIDDAVPFRFFEAARSQVVGNKLVIGFGIGRDPATWRANDFRASTAAFSHRTAMDTISFTIQAPSGYYISKITYFQKGTGSVLRTGVVSGAATWVVNDISYSIGTFSTRPTLTRSLDLSRQRWTSVPVSITPALFAYATPSGGSATVSITSAEVVAEVAPL